ncbi:MAG: hypothetical protein LH649_14680 [Pseudanabaena sp. CAN_BIN31]|nr:hypothetical protein [Pseudanabaena sp. CAN_BIN31]
MLPQIFVGSQCDRLNNHLLKFVSGDRYLTQPQIFSNDLICFRGRSQCCTEYLGDRFK